MLREGKGAPTEIWSMSAYASALPMLTLPWVKKFGNLQNHEYIIYAKTKAAV